jgi:DNA replication and repair protein RecF
VLAVKIAASRGEILQAVEQHLQHFLKAMSFSDKVSLVLRSGWKESLPLIDVLKEHLDRDLAQRHTSAGPHRAELKIQVAGGRAEKHLSRGQQKVLVYGLVFALSRLIVDKKGEAPVLLIDDLGAELDERNRAALIDYLVDTGEQVFISSVDVPAPSSAPAGARVFHVEHGTLRAT